ncbi:unnamed protein product [Prunus brigantina]
MANLGRQHLNAVKWVFRYLKGTKKLGILFERQQRKACVLGYVNLDYAGDIDKRRSTTRYVSNCGGGPISWRDHWIKNWVNDGDIAIKKSVVELLGVTRTISKRFEEVLEVNDFHKVFRLAKVEIVDVGSPKDVE